MIRARRTEFRRQLDIGKEYNVLQREFGVQPYLETLIAENAGDD